MKKAFKIESQKNNKIPIFAYFIQNSKKLLFY